ncbi:NFACT RNA binding domain-containing protein [Leadbetterella sp. DM7]|uniref:NFACT RNA binding domain-containing protein n=1 Tax=Leadbetterella sp. DM7 TaxID=3235085 RepID=UPI00349E538A
MHNNYFFLRKLAAALNGLLSGTQLLTCFSQEKDELVLGFSNNVYLKCILKPDFSSVTVADEFSRARKNSVSLWEELYGNTVNEIRVFENERAVKIALGQEFTLVIKLFGNRPNFLVYRGNTLTAMFNNKLLTDKTLKPEDFDRELNADFATFESLDGNYRKQFFTLGKDLSEALDRAADGLDIPGKWEKVVQLLAYLENPRFYIDSGGPVPKLSLLQGEEQPDALSAINAFVSRYQKVTALDRLKSDLTGKLVKDMAKTRNYISTTRDKLDELLSGVKNEEIGNILMANLHAVKEGATEVELDNFYTGEPVRIRLKKELSPQKNAEAYYRKSKNEKIEIETAQKNLEAAGSKLEALAERLQEIERTEDLRQLRGVSKEMASSANAAAKDDLPFKEYTCKGIKIWVGRNAKNNDLLTTQYARKDDWWLHARDTSGSHVVIKSPNPSSEVLEYAASLAAGYSKRKSEKLVTVLYTQKKYVRKAKNLAAGQVIVEKEKTLLVEPRKE